MNTDAKRKECAETECKFNEGVSCRNLTEAKCGCCGWNPKIEAERKAKIRKPLFDNAIRQKYFFRLPYIN